MKHAIKGRKYEWKIRDLYRRMGYYVTRSAGSRGIFDLIAINQQTNHIVLIQCKAGKLTEKEKEKIKKEMSQFEGTYEVTSALE